MQKFKIIPVLSFLVLACSNTPTNHTTKTIAKAVSLAPITPKEKEYYAALIAPLYQSMLLQKGFNGAIIAAKNGEIVFEDYHGLYNYKTKDSITALTPFHIASTSKTFTAMVILHLMEQGKLNIEDNVKQYLPTFPYANITIKNLLTHRSALANYVHFMDGGSTIQTIRKKNKKGKTITVRRVISNKKAAFKGIASNNDVLQYMIDHKIALEGNSNSFFRYCNTNYALLALIIEKVTAQDFPRYMMDSVFVPLGMKSSFVFSKKDTANYHPSYQPNWAAFKFDKLDCVYGDKNVYSTVRDLLQWDKALYAGKFVSPKTLEMAFAGYSNEKKGEHNYGLGWRLITKPNQTIVYHNGWWHGNNAVFQRLIKDTATIIILGNKFNRNIYTASKMSSVFTGVADTTKTIE
ncbi:MAG: serine hydrolase domain-containing protein [Flavobacterium sp.]|nr:serine hydrolase domain-containing protein [Flavobacterium sp.]